MDQVKKIQKEEKKARRQSWGVTHSKGLAGASGSSLLRQKSKDDLDLHLELAKSQAEAKQVADQTSSSVPSSPHQKKKKVFNLFGSWDKEAKKEKKEKKSKNKDKSLDPSLNDSSSSSASTASDKSASSYSLNNSQNSDSSSSYSPSSSNSSNSINNDSEATSPPVLQPTKSEKPKLKSFLSSRSIHSSRTERKNQQAPLEESNSSVNSTSSVPIDKQPKRTLTITSLHEKFANTSLQRRGSVVFEKLGLASSATERKLKKDVVSKLKYINETEPAYLEALKNLAGTSSSKQFDDDDYKQLAKHLIDLEQLTKFFDADEVADYNKTHGDGINLSSRDFFKKVHIQTSKRQERTTTKISPKPLTLTPSPSLELTDEDERVWSSIEEKVKDYFWNVWPLKIFLTTGCCSKSKTGEQETDHFAKPYAALQIGNRVLEWNRSSLCIPFEADYYFSNCLAAVELNVLEDVGALLKEDITKICPIIVEWNANKAFSSLNCNSQDFVDIVLTSLGFEPMFRGKLGTAMKELQSSLNPLEHQFKLTFQIHVDTVNIDAQSMASLKSQTLVRTTSSTVMRKDASNASNLRAIVAQAVMQGSGTNKTITRTVGFRSHKDVDTGYHDMKELKVLTREDFCFLLLIDRIYWMWWNVTSQDSPTQKLSLEKRELKARSTCKNCAFGWPWKEGSVQEKSRTLAYSRTTSVENPGQVQ